MTAVATSQVLTRFASHDCSLLDQNTTTDELKKMSENQM